jgi:hypothetical protein
VCYTPQQGGNSIKKGILLAALVLLAFSLVQCELFSTTVQYVVTGNDTEPLQIMYASSSGDLTEITASNYWTYSFDYLNSDEKKLAFIRTTKATGTLDFTAEIRVNGTIYATDTQPAGSTITLYWVVE